MRILNSLLVLGLLTLASSAPARALDFNGDGLADFGVFHDQSGTVTYYSGSGEQLGSAVPLVSGTFSPSNPLLWPATFQGSPAVYAVAVGGSKENPTGTLSLLTASGIAASIDLGDLQGSVAAVGDVNANGETDFIVTNATQVSVYLDSGSSPQKKTYNLPSGIYPSYVSVVDGEEVVLALLVDGQGRSKSFAAYVQLTTGKFASATFNRKVPFQTYPYPGTYDLFALTPKGVTWIDAPSGKVTSGSRFKAAGGVPGNFLPVADRQILSVTGTTVKIFNLKSGSVLKSFQLPVASAGGRFLPLGSALRSKKKQRSPGLVTNPGGGNLSACGTVQAWPSTLIYKTVGSDHFSYGDARRSAVNVIAKWGWRGGSDGCIEILAKNGKLLGTMGDYGQSWSGGPYRWYGPTGCGTLGTSGSGLAAQARSASGSSNIYVKIGFTCYGPIDASRCRGSSSC